jgi:hypothetical protein
MVFLENPIRKQSSHGGPEREREDFEERWSLDILTKKV